MTNADYIRNCLTNKDIAKIINAIDDYDFCLKAWIVFKDSFLKSNEYSLLEERRFYRIWLTKQYDEKIWKKVLDKYLKQ